MCLLSVWRGNNYTLCDIMTSVHWKVTCAKSPFTVRISQTTFLKATEVTALQM